MYRHIIEQAHCTIIKSLFYSKIDIEYGIFLLLKGLLYYLSIISDKFHNTLLYKIMMINFLHLRSSLIEELERHISLSNISESACRFIFKLNKQSLVLEIPTHLSASFSERDRTKSTELKTQVALY